MKTFSYIPSDKERECLTEALPKLKASYALLTEALLLLPSEEIAHAAAVHSRLGGLIDSAESTLMRHSFVEA